jgi:hypothetical protein
MGPGCSEEECLLHASAIDVSLEWNSSCANAVNNKTSVVMCLEFLSTTGIGPASDLQGFIVGCSNCSNT